jgi:hypothetical protein
LCGLSLCLLVIVIQGLKRYQESELFHFATVPLTTF